VKIRKEVPELPTSIRLHCSPGAPPIPRMFQSAFISIPAPISFAARRAALASSETSPLLSLEIPSAIQAKATALIVWDLEAGIRMLPDKADLFDLISTAEACRFMSGEDNQW
jgi:hypothetical protein